MRKTNKLHILEVCSLSFVSQTSNICWIKTVPDWTEGEEKILETRQTKVGTGKLKTTNSNTIYAVLQMEEICMSTFW